jgi:hypothetical protein
MPTIDSEFENIESESILTEGKPLNLYLNKKNYKPKSDSKKEKFGYFEYNPEKGQQIFKVRND